MFTLLQTQSINQAILCLKQGKLVAIPTETVYGLAADAKNPEAIAKIFTVKQRPQTNPLIIHLSDLSAMQSFAINIPESAYALAERFWPGPLTLILERHPDLPQLVTAGQNTVALRVPNHPLTLELLKQFKGGVAAPSANRSGRISPTTASDVTEELGSKVDYILDGGPCQIGIESTILSLIHQEPIILRQGSIEAEQISHVLGKKVSKAQDHFKHIIVPGSSLVHYAPLHPLYLLSFEELLQELNQGISQHKKMGVLSFQQAPSFFSNHEGLWIKEDCDPKRYARSLYANLRKLDNAEVDFILVETPPKQEIWGAVLDRLKRASYT